MVLRSSRVFAHRRNAEGVSTARPGVTGALVEDVDVGRWYRSYGLQVFLAVGLFGAALLVAAIYHLPVRDPDDSVVGPVYVRLPLVVVTCFLIDVLVRCLRRGGLLGLRSTVLVVLRERWPAARVRLVLIGMGSWYLAYVGFRNLKSYVPFVRPHMMDDTLVRIDRQLAFGHDPATLLHDLLGTGVAAHLMSFTYVAWILFLTLSLLVALFWSRDIRTACWYVTAVAVNWVLGVSIYYLVPSVGPIYVRPSLFADLPQTQSSDIAQSWWAGRVDMLADPFATQTLQTVAAFASLHVSVMVTASLIASMTRLKPGLVRWGLWLFLFLNIVATVYLGWHYVVDVIGGMAIGVAAVWTAAYGTGNRHRLPSSSRTHGWSSSIAAAPTAGVHGAHPETVGDVPPERERARTWPTVMTVVRSGGSRADSRVGRPDEAAAVGRPNAHARSRTPIPSVPPVGTDSATRMTPGASDDHIRKPGEDSGTRRVEEYRWVARVWLLVALFAGVTIARACTIGIPVRDPHGAWLRSRLALSLGLLVVLVLGEAGVRARRRGRSVMSMVDAVRSRWNDRPRVALALGGLTAYYAVYLCYHNLKSWNVFHAPRDDMLQQWDRLLFLGHSPAELLHGLLGRGAAAYVLTAIYMSFSTVVTVAVVAALVFSPRIRDGYVFLTSALWVWILGVASYYLVPSLGPFSSAPQDFADLALTRTQETQAHYLAQRADLLAHPGAADAAAQLAAFASLHVAVICVIALVAHLYGLRRVTWVMTVYLVGTVVATVYLGWHFAVDVVAGLAIAFLAVVLGRVTVYGRAGPRGSRDRAEAASAGEDMASPRC
jgi:membrane-associated phospholipid phosphatase